MSFIGNGTIATVYATATTNLTGSEFLTLLGLFVVFVFLGLSARLDFDIVLMGVSGMLITFLAYNGEFMLMGTIGVIFLGFVTAKYYFG